MLPGISDLSIVNLYLHYLLLRGVDLVNLLLQNKSKLSEKCLLRRKRNEHVLYPKYSFLIENKCELSIDPINTLEEKN